MSLQKKFDLLLQDPPYAIHYKTERPSSPTTHLQTKTLVTSLILQTLHCALTNIKFFVLLQTFLSRSAPCRKGDKCYPALTAIMKM